MALSSFKPSQSSTPVVLNLIIINVIVYIAQQIFDASPLDPGWFTSKLALWNINSPNFEFYQFITHMFAHGGIFHILVNMYMLWLFGSALEKSWGAVRFIIFYLVCGLAAGIAQMLLVPYAQSIGASGAIMGLMAAFAYTYPNLQFYIIPIPFPVKVKWLVAGYAVLDIFGGFSGSDGIAHFAHLGGLVMGLILVIIWSKKKKKPSY